ncbi:MAG TPA: DUF433 domain-containing protein [Pirellulales bacterium]|jgi:uncharacterized protein (DUF433 family)|nr:DUF433 domain-containing protein [Pirellulales bacterium]
MKCRQVQRVGVRQEVRSGKCGGIPVLKGTRFTVAQLFAELAEGESIDSLANEFDLDRAQLSTLLHALAVRVDVPADR